MLDLAPLDALSYLLTGAGAGFAAGLLGVGGGLIIVPVLFLVFTAQGIATEHLMHTALATSLATIVFTSISSTRAHHKKNAVLWPLVLLLAPGIALGAWLGGTFAAGLNTAILKPVFGVFELLVAIHLLRKSKPAQHQLTIDRLRAALGGSVIGFVSSLVGIGGGTLTVPFLHWHNIAIRNAVATSAACGLPIALFGTASFIYSGWNIHNLPAHSLGFVNLPAFICIVITSYLCAPLGARVAHAVSDTALKTGFGIFLLVLAASMLLA